MILGGDRMTFMQKIMAGIVLPLAFCLVGGFFASQGFDYFKTKRDKKHRCLSQTNGKIVRVSSMSASKNFRRTYFPTYEYVVDDEVITVEIYFGTTSCQYKSGDTVKIWYDKSNPKYSYIDGYRQDNISSMVNLALGSITVLCGLIAAVLVWVM